MGTSKMANILMICVILVEVEYVIGNVQLPEEERTSNSECYEGDEMQCSCEAGYHVLVRETFVGSKLRSAACPSSWNATLNANESCCEPSIHDCLYPIDKRSTSGFCNGRMSCSVKAQNSIINTPTQKCNVSNITAYNQNTGYMYVDYWCIEERRIVGVGGSELNATMENVTVVYAINDMYPAPGVTMDYQEYSWVITSDSPNATFTFHTILLAISENMTIRVTDGNQSEIGTWLHNNNSYIAQSLVTMVTKLQITITNNGSKDEGEFWFGFETAVPTNVTILYQALVDHNVSDVTTTSMELFNTTMNMTDPMAVTDDENITLYIAMTVGICFVVIFAATVITVLCVMRRRHVDEVASVDMRRASEDLEKYFMVSTEYKRVTAFPGMYDEEPPEYATPNKLKPEANAQVKETVLTETAGPEDAQQHENEPRTEI